MSNRHPTCPNCECILPPNAKYCPNCAQRYRSEIPKFWQFVGEGISDFFSIDGRFWRTITDLFVPGKLTLAWFQRKHRRYLPPVRVAVVAALGLVAAALFMIGNDDFLQIGNYRSKELRRITAQKDLARLDTLTANLRDENPAPAFQRAIDSVRIRMGITSDSMVYGQTIRFVSYINGSLNDGAGAQKVLTEDVYSDISADSLLRKYEVEGFVNRLIFRQNVRLRRKGDSFGAYLLTSGAWGFLLTIPVAALLMKLLYVRRGYRYLQHVVFLLHTNSALSVGFILMVLFGKYAPGWIIGGGFLMLAVFTYLAMWRAYQQHWFKTWVKFTALGSAYLFLFLPTVTMIVLMIRVAMY